MSTESRWPGASRATDETPAVPPRTLMERGRLLPAAACKDDAPPPAEEEEAKSDEPAPTKEAAPEAAPKEPEEPKVIYESLEITQPENDKAIRSNEGKVTALARSVPALDSNHRFRWSMDGTPVQEVNAPELRLNNVNRGTHTLQVQIVDADGKVVMSSETITFHLMRYRIPTGP